MTGSVFKKSLLSTTVMAGMVIAASPALAQNADGTTPETQADIVVTGSRIARPNLDANSPIAVVSGEEAVEQADITLDTFLNTLPQVNPAGSSTSNNPGNAGQSNVNLRGLGANRNLVLIDGRRPMVSASDQTVDLNTIPQGLIERIEIVTGGAGATYGADAIAGVVNIITRNNFQGIDLRATYQQTIPELDSREYQISGVIGGNFADNRGNIAVAFDYSEREGLIKAQRPFAAQATSTTGTPPVGRLIEVNTIPQTAIDALFASYGVPAGQRPVSGGSQLHFNSDGTLFGSGTFNTALNVSNYRYDPLGRDAAGANQNFFPDFYSYNFDAINLLVAPLERKSAFLRGNYEISSSFEVFVQAGFTEYSSANALAPTPIGTRIYRTGTAPSPQFATSDLIQTGFITNSVIPITNPFIPANLRTLLNARTGDDPNLVGSGATEPFRLGIRSLNTGLRQSTYENQVIQLLAGLRGEITEGWRYEIYHSWGRTTIDQAAAGNVNVQNLQRLLEAPDGGNSLCAGGYNPFGIQPLSAACVEFLNETGFTTTQFTQNITQGYVSGTLGTLPAGDVGVVVGAERRSFRYTFDPGALFGPIAGFNTSTPDNGTNEFFDIFGEVAVPLLRDRPWAQSLELNLGYRLSNSSFEDIQNGIQGDDQSSSAYKVELSWAPVDEFRLRASYQRSVRAPNFGELFSGGSSFVQAFDPCSINTNFRQSGGAAATALCQATGIPASAVNSFVATPGLQVNLGIAGNPNLEPEAADTITIGAVFRALGFTGSIDYYNIKINDPIFGADTNLFIASCYGYQGGAALAASNPYCSSIVRAGGNFSFVNVAPSLGGTADGELPFQNLGGIQTSGIDVQLAYRLPTEFAGPESALLFNFYANYLLEYKVEELPGVTLDYAGTASYFGADLGQSFPRFRANLNTTWDFGVLALDTRLRYISSMDNRASVQFPGESFTGPDEVFYFDAALQAEFDNFTFRIGLNNVFDQDPPTYAPNVQSGTDPSLYDVLGRRAYASIRLRF